MDQIIFHIDMDCFFAAIEARDNVEYRGKPLIVGADPKEGKGRGVVSTCSYEARKFGIHSAMPISQAYKRCPHGIYVFPNGKKYYKVSEEVMEIVGKYSQEFQKVGVDEAYLNMTNVCQDFEEARLYANRIKEEIQERIGVTCSIGVGPTKSIAKIASDHNKPNGITVVEPDSIYKFLEDMDITRIPGIGKKTKKYYNKHGFKKIGDLIKTPLPRLMELFGKNVKWIWKIIHGLDKRTVQEFPNSRKSISQERTYFEDTNNFTTVMESIEKINQNIHKQLKKNNIFYKTITLKIRFQGFETYTRAKSLQNHIRDKTAALKIILELYKEFSNKNKKVRLLGIKFSNLEKDIKAKQTNLMQYS
jgi:DNA polymerase IV (DinB-like DNA polymerase)